MSDCNAREELLARLRPHGQEHVLHFWDELSPQQRLQLGEQLERVDLAGLARLFQQRGEQTDIRALAERAESPPAYRMTEGGQGLSPAQAVALGAEALAAGEVAALVVAGGQGTRLGFDHPKGMFPIGPVSDHTLFQIHIEKLLAAARRYGKPVPLCVMTSPATHDETVEFLAANDRFGLAKEDILIFRQGTMPAVDDSEGKLLLAERDHLALSPDGHGGMLAAAEQSGAFARLAERGIRHLFYFQVDNPLVQVASPELIGYHLAAKSELTTQVVAKQDPADRVGNVVSVDGRLHVIEYSDLPADIAAQRDARGNLKFWAGSIAVHVMDVAFLRRMSERADALPFHIAHKKVPHLDAGGQLIEPTKPNALKFERFIFDLLPRAERAVVVEVDPARGFAPLKNAPGAVADTAEHVRRSLVAEHARWLRAAGAEVQEGVAVEISPSYAMDEAELCDKLPAGVRVTEPRLFC